MLKPLLGIAATGVAAVVIWKILAVILLPMIGLAIGLAALVIKMFVLLFVLLIAYWLYKRSTGQGQDSMA